MFLNQGKNNIRDLLVGSFVIGSPSYAAVGSDGTNPVSTNTTLGSEINRTRRVFDSKNSAVTKQVEFEMILPSTEPSGIQPIFTREIGIFTGSPTGSIYSRSVFSEFEKTGDIEVQYIVAYRIE